MFYLPKKPNQLANDAEKVSWVELFIRTVERNKLADAGATFNVLARHFDKQTSAARAKASLPALFVTTWPKSLRYLTPCYFNFLGALFTSGE